MSRTSVALLDSASGFEVEEIDGRRWEKIEMRGGQKISDTSRHPPRFQILFLNAITVSGRCSVNR